MPRMPPGRQSCVGKQGGEAPRPVEGRQGVAVRALEVDDPVYGLTQSSADTRSLPVARSASYSRCKQSMYASS